MTVEVIVHSDMWRRALPDAQTLSEAVYTAMRHELPFIGEGCHACLCLSDNDEVQALNGRYRQKNKPTNVLSFPAEDRLPGSRTVLRDAFLGDVIMALETMQAEARDGHLQLEHHFSHLLVHGLLHLLGYDHETDREAGIMEPLEVRILARLGVPDPYAGADA